MSKFNNKKHRRLTALLLCVALMLGSVTSVSADISAADSETEVQSEAQTYAEEAEAEAVAYEEPEVEAQAEVEEEAPVETQAPETEAVQTEGATEAVETTDEQQVAEETSVEETVIESETELESETETEVVAQQLDYEDDQVKVHVTAKEEGIIPENASLKVVPLVKQEITDDMTDEQKQEVEAINKKYDEAEQKLFEKADNEAFDIAGFLAYDIGFVDVDGNEVEPNGDVKVTMEYKKAQAPEGIEVTEDTELTVMHLEEDKDGEVKQVVDLADDSVANGAVEKLQTNEENKLEKVEFVSDSFSTFTVTWKNTTISLIIHYVDKNGTEILGTRTAADFKDYNGSVTFATYAGAISGYEYSSARLNSATGKTVTSAQGSRRSNFLGSSYTYYLSIKNGSKEVEQLSSGYYGARTADIYLVYNKINETETPDTPDRPNQPTDVDIKLSHEKYIKKKAASNTYDVTLNVSSRQGSKTNKKKMDIVLLLDVSSSMVNDKSTKLKNSKNAISELVNALNSKSDEVDVQYRLVTFGNTAEVKTGWVDGTSVNRTVSGIKIPEGVGTNYEDGLKKAATALSSGTRSGAESIVIFLTDGMPTFRNGGSYNGHSGYQGPGGSTSYAVYDAAKKAAAELTCDRFIPVGIGLGKVTKYGRDDRTDQDAVPDKGETLLQNVANETKAKVVDKVINADSTGSNLANIFKSIAADIQKFACKNVTVKDTLSQYVDTTESSQLKIKVAKKTTVDGQDIYTEEGTVMSIPLTDTDLLSDTGKTVTVGTRTLGTVKYNANAKQFEWNMGADYELEDDIYYYITITDIQPNRTAVNTYEGANDKYNATGDAATDASENGYFAVNGSDSSNLSGFYSNDSDNHNSSVSYTDTKRDKYIKEDYQKPVVQLDSIPVEKAWENGSPTKGAEVLVQLLYNGSSVDGRILLLNAENHWKGKFAVEKGISGYSVKELTANENGNITYNGKRYSLVDDGANATVGNQSYKVSYTRKGDTLVITNTKNSQTMKIVKQSNSGINLKGAEFTLTDAGDKQITCQISDGNGIVFDGEIDYGTYTLTEIKAPSGYTVLADSIIITVDGKGITVFENDKVKVAEDGITIIVKNDMLYSLPSTGGSGIFWYSICGMLLMMAAAWIIYKNKCREVLVK
ncbi:VWA domain-containing protein [Coprococcus catus]|uniref:DUF7604 domain-containing protein n=1 Tax=Coprococcus catus TaxID=116085 RepID=UPI001D065074|nr:SpaA isopeptide-forming pilin-related protein [Coprococcus catus]MCB6491360.1 VWA domain-containing protein [Coprococcus catus]